jgi:hypothetical protein
MRVGNLGTARMGKHRFILQKASYRIRRGKAKLKFWSDYNVAYMNSVELVRKQCYIKTAVVKASHLLELARENHNSCKGRPDHL